MATKREKSSSPEREKESLRTLFTKKHLEKTKDGESDRESCASHRSQDSLDIDGKCFQLTGQTMFMFCCFTTHLS